MKRMFNCRHRTVAWTIACLSLISALQISDVYAAGKFKAFKLKTVDGVKKTLQDFSNKVTLVSFYYPTCAYCNLAAPEIQKLYDKYKDKGLSVVIVNVKPDEESRIPGWLAKYHLTMPVLIGASQDSLMDDYDLTMTPTHCLLAGDREILLRQNGYNRGDEKAIEAKIAEALNTQAESGGPEGK